MQDLGCFFQSDSPPASLPRAPRKTVRIRSAADSDIEEITDPWFKYGDPWEAALVKHGCLPGAKTTMGGPLSRVSPIAPQPWQAELPRSPRIRRKFDPVDLVAYTFEELQVKRSGQFDKEGFWEFWSHQCADAPDVPFPVRVVAADPRGLGRGRLSCRMDPEDGRVYAFLEFMARAVAEGYSQQEAVDYWDLECKPVEAKRSTSAMVARPGERRVDPEDSEACTFDELEAKMANEFSFAEIREYWDEDCVRV